MVYDVAQFKINLRIIKHLLQTRMILLASKSSLLEIPEHWDDDDDDEDIEDGGYKMSGNSMPPRKHIQLPVLHSPLALKKNRRPMRRD